MKNLIYLAMVLAMLTVACKTKKKKPSNEMNKENRVKKIKKDKNKALKIIDTTKIAKNPKTSKIIDAYLQIKNALVSDNQKEAIKGAVDLLGAFSEFNIEKLDNTTLKKYMNIYQDAKEDAEHISKSPIKHQREHFKMLSSEITDLIELLGTDKILYQDFCPMSKSNWISEVKEIKNPFYGKKMMECGMIRRKIN